MKSDVTNLIAGTGLGWNPGSPGTNTSGFTALPGGYRADNGSFGNVRDNAFFWSATVNPSLPTTHAFYRYLVGNGVVLRLFNGKSYGASVRCLRD